MKRENLAVGLSVVALLVSILSLWASWEVQRHNRTVAFEQRRQEVRQLMLQGQVILQQIDQELRAALREGKTPNERELIADILGESNSLREGNALLLKSFDAIPPTPDTDSRLALERIGGRAIQANQKAQHIFQRVQDWRARSKRVR